MRGAGQQTYNTEIILFKSVRVRIAARSNLRHHYSGLHEIYHCADFDLQNMSLIDRGVTGTMYQLNVFIAVKRARLKMNEKIDHANEQRKFKFFENYSSILYLIRCYYRTSKDTFLELASNESIAMLLDQYQQRDRHDIHVFKIKQALSSQNVHR